MWKWQAWINKDLNWKSLESFITFCVMSWNSGCYRGCQVYCPRPHVFLETEKKLHYSPLDNHFPDSLSSFYSKNHCVWDEWNDSSYIFQNHLKSLASFQEFLQNLIRECTNKKFHLASCYKTLLHIMKYEKWPPTACDFQISLTINNSAWPKLFFYAIAR